MRVRVELLIAKDIATHSAMMTSFEGRKKGDIAVETRFGF